MKHHIRLIAAAVLAAALSARAQSSFTGRLVVSPDWLHSKTGAVVNVTERFGRILEQAHTHGTNAGQMNAVCQYAATLTNSQETVYELATGLADSFGDTVVFTRVNVLAVKAAASNAGDIHVGGAVATPFASWIGSTNTYVVLKPGGLLLLTAPDAAGYSTADGSLRIANAATNAAAYHIYIGGCQ